MKTESWVVRERSTKEVLFETYDIRKVQALNTAAYEAVPILKHLQELNKRIQDNERKNNIL